MCCARLTPTALSFVVSTVWQAAQKATAERTSIDLKFIGASTVHEPGLWTAYNPARFREYAKKRPGWRPARPLALFLCVRVAAGAELDRERRADELECLSEIALEVALVGRRHAIEGVAVNDDARRVDAALVRVAQLRAHQPALGRRLALDRRNHGARELRRRQPRHRRRMGAIDCAHELPQPLGALGRDEVRFGEAEEAELPLQ